VTGGHLVHEVALRHEHNVEKLGLKTTELGVEVGVDEVTARRDGAR